MLLHQYLPQRLGKAAVHPGWGAFTPGWITRCKSTPAPLDPAHAARSLSLTWHVAGITSGENLRPGSGV